MEASPHHEFPNYADLLDRVEQLRQLINADYDRLTKDIPDCRWADARLAAVGRLGMLLDDAYLSFTFISQHLLPLDNPWWRDVHKPPFAEFTDYHKSVTANNFNGFTKVGFLQSLFSNFETHVRIFLRAVDSTAAGGATSTFDSVYGALRSRLSTFPPETDELVKLMSLTRNTVHNNGVFFPTKCGDAQVTYKTVTYDFHFGKAIKFVSWEWLLDRLEDIWKLLVHIVYDPQIMSITDEVADPFDAK